MSMSIAPGPPGRALAALAAGAVMLTACAPDANDSYDEDPDGGTEASSDGEASEPAADGGVEPNGVVVDVLALDNTFRPEEVEIEAGTEVRWKNGGRNDHNVLPVDETLGWGVDVEGFTPGDVYSTVFGSPGVYPYYCSLHGTADFGMIGTITVTG